MFARTSLDCGQKAWDADSILPFSAGFDRHTEKNHASPVQNEVPARGLGFDVVAVCLRAHWPTTTARPGPSPDSSRRCAGTGSAATTIVSLTADEEERIEGIEDAFDSPGREFLQHLTIEKIHMDRIVFCTIFSLAMAMPAGVSAQTSVQPGKWELTSTFKGLPSGGGERTHAVCLTQAALQTLPEKALIEASPPPGDDSAKRPRPQCEYLQVRRDGAKSSWSTSCSEPKAIGSGSATVHSPQQVELHEELEVKKGFMSLKIQHDVRARRIGECP